MTDPVFLRQILWRYEVPMRARDIRRARAVVRQNSVNIYEIRPRRPRRVRREYRTLSQEEREDFQKAMNELYEVCSFVYVFVCSFSVSPHDCVCVIKQRSSATTTFGILQPSIYFF